LRRLLALPHGLILITGPDRKRKDHDACDHAVDPERADAKKILTIEDPVEYEIPGVNQSQVKPAIGLTFAHRDGARFVRQDPDVIMVGENPRQRNREHRPSTRR